MDYEYRCPCGYIFTKKFPFTKNPKYASCPECGSLIATRYFGAVPSICFKGPGWASKSELDPRDPKNDNPQDFEQFTGV